MKSRQIGVFFPDKHRSKRARAAATYSIPPSRILAERLTSLSFMAALVLFVFVRTGWCQDAPAAASMPASVTASTLEAKIAGAEAATGLQDEAKTKLIELYRKALSNLQVTTSSRNAAQAFQQASQTAPAETQALRKKIE
jgi:potassium efflux system protein